tara:strand:- start:1136 stop:1345 length:210 start_codon:yes stop_codon:yes gene_type:complete
MADLRLHNVSEIKVLKRNDIGDLSVRTLVITNEEYSTRENKRVMTTTEITCYLDDKSASKIVYSKDKYR